MNHFEYLVFIVLCDCRYLEVCGICSLFKGSKSAGIRHVRRK